MKTVSQKKTCKHKQLGSGRLLKILSYMLSKTNKQNNRNTVYTRTANFWHLTNKITKNHVCNRTTPLYFLTPVC